MTEYTLKYRAYDGKVEALTFYNFFDAECLAHSMSESLKAPAFIEQTSSNVIRLIPAAKRWEPGL